MKKWVIGIIIIVVLSVCGFYFFSGENSTYNLTEKFGLTGEVIDYGVYGEHSEQVEKFAEKYAEDLEKGEKLYFVFGNNEEINLITYQDLMLGKIDLLVGNKQTKIKIQDSEKLVNKILPQTKTVKILIGEKEYDFDLKGEENIYLVVSEERGIIEEF